MLIHGGDSGHKVTNTSKPIGLTETPFTQHFQMEMESSLLFLSIYIKDALKGSQLFFRTLQLCLCVNCENTTF